MASKPLFTMSKYSGFFSAYNASVTAGNPLTREEQISTFTEGRTTSLKELSADELAALTRQLNALTGFSPKNPQHEDKADVMRKAIISIFYKMGHTVADAKAWAEKQGVKGVKKEFNDYNPGELYVLIQIADKALRDYRAAIRKALTR